MPTKAVGIPNDRVLHYFELHKLPMLSILTDKGTEYCGKVSIIIASYIWRLTISITQKKPYHLRKTASVNTTYRKTILNEFYQVTFSKKLYSSLEELQKDLDEWMVYYNNDRTHQGKMCCGRTPLATFEDGKRIWAEKNLDQI